MLTCHYFIIIAVLFSLPGASLQSKFYVSFLNNLSNILQRMHSNVIVANVGMNLKFSTHNHSGRMIMLFLLFVDSKQKVRAQWHYVIAVVIIIFIIITTIIIIFILAIIVILYAIATALFLAVMVNIIIVIINIIRDILNLCSCYMVYTSATGLLYF